MAEQSALDHALKGSGVEIDGVTFRLHQEMVGGTWRVGEGETRFHKHVGEELTLSNVGAAMDVRPGAEEGGKLIIYVADNLRPQLREIVMALQDEQREGAVIVSIAKDDTIMPHLPGTFTLSGLTEVEAKAAERAIDALREGKLLAAIPPEVPEKLLVKEHDDSLSYWAGSGTSEWLALTESVMEAQSFAASLEPFSVEHVAREVSAIDSAWMGALAPPVRMGDTLIVPIKVDGAEVIVSFLQARGLTVPPPLGELVANLENLLAKSPRPLWDGNIGSCHVTTNKSLDFDVWIVDGRSRRDLDPRILGEKTIKGAKRIEVPESYAPILTALAESPATKMALTAEKLLDLTPGVGEERIPSHPEDKLYVETTLGDAEDFLGPAADLREATLAGASGNLLQAVAEAVKGHREGWRDASPIITRRQAGETLPPASPGYRRLDVLAPEDPHHGIARALEVSIHEQQVVLHFLGGGEAASYDSAEVEDLIELLWTALDDVGPARFHEIAAKTREVRLRQAIHSALARGRAIQFNRWAEQTPYGEAPRPSTPTRDNDQVIVRLAEALFWADEDIKRKGIDRAFQGGGGGSGGVE